MEDVAKSFVEPVHFSVITDTGYEQANKITQNVSFLPYEIFLPFWERRSKLLVVAEAELWLMLFAVSKLKGSKTVLVNARISDKSYKNYKRFKFFYKFLFSFVDMVLAQSEKDAGRLVELGAKNITITGNTKISQKYEPLQNYLRDEKIVVTAASTHPDEEEAVFDAFYDAFEKGSARLIIVPRHPERFDSVYEIIKNKADEKALSVGRFSRNRNFDADVTIVDSMGELINIYAITDIAIICGSFANIGGHNPIEAAHFGCKIVTGPNIHNHKATFEVVQGYEMCEKEELSEVLKAHLQIKNSSVISEKNPSQLVKEKLHELLYDK